MGYAAEEYIGYHITQFHADRNTIEDILERLTRGEVLNKYPARLRTRDGSIKHVEINSSVQFRDGEFLNTRCFTIDVTEQVLARDEAARRIKQLSAINRFSEELQRAGSLDDVYQAALDAVVDVLGCTRASIRLRESSDDWKFVAWRGLSEEYRTKVEDIELWPAEKPRLPPTFVEDLDIADLPEALEQSMRAEGICAFAFIPLTADGRLIGRFNGYYDTPNVVDEPDKEIVNTVASQVALGIERKRIEAELRTNEERLRLATNTGKIGIWEWDITSDQVSWTDSLYAIHGVDKENFGATVESFAALVHPDDRGRVSRAIDRTLQDDAPYELEFRAIRPDGEVVWLFTNAAVLREEGSAVRLLGATMDITERKHAEEHFHLAVEAAPSGILLSDTDGRIVMANVRTEELFGYHRDELVGRPVEVLIPPPFAAGHPALRDSFAQQPEVRQMGVGRELFAQRKDGSVFPVEIGLSPIRSGRGLMVLAAIVDITERIHAAEREQMLTRELEHRAKNLLSVIQGIVRVSLSAGRSLEEAQSVLEARLQTLARSLHLLSESNWTGLSLQAIVLSELEPFDGQIAIDGCEITLEPQHAQNFSLVLHELVTNAVKYGALSHPSGRVQIHWSLEPQQDSCFLKFRWRESGGPAVVEPQRHGFGSTLIRGSFSGARLDYAPDGLRCDIEFEVTSSSAS